MEIVGTVISTDKDKVTVAVKRVSACGENCANCHGACEATTVTTVAENTAGARVGDMVKIESESASVIRAAVVLYIGPVLVTILVAALTYGINLSNLFVILFSVMAFFVSFFIIKCFEKKIAPKSYVTKIIGRCEK